MRLFVAILFQDAAVRTGSTVLLFVCLWSPLTRDQQRD